MTQVNLGTLQIDFEAMKAQLESDLSTRDAWKGNLVTQTGTTLLDWIASGSTFDAMRALRYFQDSFSQTATNPRARQAIAVEMGLRLVRKTPAQVTVRATYTKPLAGPTTVSIAEFSQFQGAGSWWFNDVAYVLSDGVPQDIVLNQGYVHEREEQGRAEDYLTFISTEKDFAVSDVAGHVQVFRNNVLVERTTGGLWQYPDQLAVSDRTTHDGRLQILFGSTRYGYRPLATDTIRIRYAVTSGLDGNSVATNTMQVTLVNAIEGCRFVFTGNPTGGANEQDSGTFSAIGASNFGNFESAVTPSQYRNSVKSYAGVLDAKVFAQRDLDPSDLRLMNVMRVYPLTSSVWTQAQKDAYLAHLQSVTMYAPRFVWFDPTPVARNFTAVVYCFATANPTQCANDARNALLDLLAMKRDHLGRDITLTDVHTAMKASNSGIDWIDIVTPLDDLLVSGKPAAGPRVTSTGASGAQIPTGVYSYSVYVQDAYGFTSPSSYTPIQLTSPGGISISWDPYPGALNYFIVGRSGPHGVIGQVSGNVTTFQDTGVAPATTPLPTLASYPVLYNTAGVISVTGKPTRRL